MVHNLETLITMSNSKMPSRIMKWGNWFIETIDLKSLLQRCIILHSYILLYDYNFLSLCHHHSISYVIYYLLLMLIGNCKDHKFHSY